MWETITGWADIKKQANKQTNKQTNKERSARANKRCEKQSRAGLISTAPPTAHLSPATHTVAKAYSRISSWHHIQLVKNSLLLFITKIQITSSLTVFLKHGQKNLQSFWLCIFDYLTSILPVKTFGFSETVEIFLTFLTFRLVLDFYFSSYLGFWMLSLLPRGLPSAAWCQVERQKLPNTSIAGVAPPPSYIFTSFQLPDA